MRTKFIETTRLNPNESITKYMYKLKGASKHCEFKKLGIKDTTLKDKLIEDMPETLHKYKILESLQINNMNLEVSIEFLQLELIKEFNQQKRSSRDLNITKFMIKCKYCGKKY